jgi:type IV secretion system protein VirB1
MLALPAEALARPMEVPVLVAHIDRYASAIHPRTVLRIVQHESARQPLAISVNGARLEHQPRSLAQAINTARVLRRQGYDFDAGLCQINMRNWRRLGLDEASVFDPRENLRACQTVLLDCYRRAPSPDSQAALRQAFSCFNTGNHRGGFANGYVSKVVAVPVAFPVATAQQEQSR